MPTKYLLAIAFLTTSLFLHAEQKPKIVVVGAGIVGASIAYHLSEQGVEVIVLDKTEPASHASRGTFAWINASWAKQPQSYHRLNQLGVSYWHELSSSLDIPIKWGGSLEWFASKERSERLIAQIDQQVQWHEPAEVLFEAQAAVLEPKVHFSKDLAIAYSPNDGAVDPQLATQIMLKHAENLGAKVHYPCEVLTIHQAESSTVKSTCGEFNADKVVLAVGANSDLILQVTGIEIPQRTTPGIIAVTKPLPILINRVIAAPGIHLHQRLDGRIVIGEQAGAPQTPQHMARLTEKPNSYPNKMLEEQHFARMLAIAVQYVPQLTNAQLESMYIGWRPLPIDGHPVVGFANANHSVYLAVMHSGVTLAPIMGKLISQELLGEEQEVLNDYRPSREFELIKRY